MTYADNLNEEGINSQYLVVMKPRRLIDSTGWTLVSGTKYTQGFDFGQVIILDDDGTAQTEASDSTLGDGVWYFDADTEILYIDIGSDPASSDIVVTYEIYVGTFDAHFNRDPLDSDTRVVYYEPLVVRSPQIRQTTTDSLFGFMPTSSAQMVLSNATHLFEKHVYDSSFSFADISIYHWLGDLDTDNMKLVFKGVSRSVGYTDLQITLSMLDRNDIFTQEYRNPVGTSFYTSGVFSDLDPTFENRPIRRVYGVVDGFVPVNVDFLEDNPTINDNRRWICIQDETNLGSVTATVPASPVSTISRTYLDSADGIRVGDAAWFNKAANEYKHVTAVNKTGNHYIDHDNLAAACVSGDTVKRSFVGNMVIIQDGVTYRPFFGRDYTEYTDATNKVAGFDFKTTLESGPLGMPSTLKPSDLVYCRLYGNQNAVTLGGSPFGSDSADTGNLTQAVVIMFDLLKNLGLAESEIDTAAFTSLQSSLTDQIGLAIPQESTQDFPTYKTLLNSIMQTVLLKIFLDDDDKWSTYQTGPLGSVAKSIEDDEILRGTVRYQFKYADLLSKVIIEYAKREINEKHQPGGNNVSRETSTSTNAERLHKIERQKTFQSLHFLSSEASTLASRLRYVLGERSGRFRFATKNRFFDTELGDNIKIVRARLPGFEYDQDTDREREFTTLSTAKGLTRIDIELEDQKGIEDNSGSW